LRKRRPENARQKGDAAGTQLIYTRVIIFSIISFRHSRFGSRSLHSRKAISVARKSSRPIPAASKCSRNAQIHKNKLSCRQRAGMFRAELQARNFEGGVRQAAFLHAWGAGAPYHSLWLPLVSKGRRARMFLHECLCDHPEPSCGGEVRARWTCAGGRFAKSKLLLKLHLRHRPRAQRLMPTRSVPLHRWSVLVRQANQVETACQKQLTVG
jgi:hypothetical protein